eukprot:scaffold188059_cov36-Tisochrysis_lutea.AAC.1
MRCHYEVLGVERDVDEEGLRKAYRKLALVWHPDKNMHQLELATETFKEIQASYAVLGDKHERAWYDDHREAILRCASNVGGGRAGGAQGDGLDEEGFDLWAYFSSSVYSGYGDDNHSFYSVYGKVFATLDRAEREHGSRGRAPAPELGGNYSNWTDIRRFYAYWESFSTSKTFTSVDPYDTRQAANRQVRRAMEKENEKARAGARKKANECVRALTAYVKKRDKRYMEHLAAAEREKAAQAERVAVELKARQAAHDALRAQERRERTAAWDASEAGAQLDELLASYSGDEERASKKKKGRKCTRGKLAVAMGSGSLDENEEGDEAATVMSLSSSSEPITMNTPNDTYGLDFVEGAVGLDLEDAESFYCAACNKHFKNLRQWQNHERSKKHVQRVKQLRAELEAEDIELERIAEVEAASSVGESRDDLHTPNDSQSDVARASLDASMQSLSVGRAAANASGADASPIPSDGHEECSSGEFARQVHNGSDMEQGHGTNDSSSGDEERSLLGLVRAKMLNVTMSATPAAGLEGDDEEDGVVGREEKDADVGGDAGGDEAGAHSGSDTSNIASQLSPGNGLNAAARKRAKKALRKEASGVSESSVTNTCKICGLQCPSRTKLFQHIEQTGHAFLKTSH